MNSFNFGRAVEIEGEVYHLSGEFERIKATMEDVQSVLTDPNSTNVKKQIAYASGIDAVLGEGSFKKIFGGRPFSIIEATELIIFLTDEVKEWSKELQ